MSRAIALEPCSKRKSEVWKRRRGSSRRKNWFSGCVSVPVPAVMTQAKPAPNAVPDHELLQVIGRGSYGEVWLARNVLGTLRAVKIIRRDSFSNARPFERE